jgi:hypothetical protein
MRIELHIERLVVEGLPLAGGRAAAAAGLRGAVEAELTRALLGADETAFVASAEASRRAGIVRASIVLPPDPGPNDVGTAIAGALGGAIVGEPDRPAGDVR